jgi:hypothetical protein
LSSNVLNVARNPGKGVVCAAALITTSTTRPAKQRIKLTAQRTR